MTRNGSLTMRTSSLLGKAHFPAGEDAVKRFPDHSKVPFLREMLPSVFGPSETEDSKGSS
jgi:hypothetical protein